MHANDTNNTNSHPHSFSPSSLEGEMKRGRGFTIAEILVVIGLFALLSVFIVGIYFSHDGLYHSQSAEINAVGTARGILDDMTDAVRESAAVASFYVYGGQTYSSDIDTLVLRLPAVDASGNPIPAVYDYAIYYIDSADPTKFRKVLDANPLSSRREEDRLLSDYLDAVSFVYNNSPVETANKVTINLTTSDASRLNTRNITLTQEAFLRNK